MRARRDGCVQLQDSDCQLSVLTFSKRVTFVLQISTVAIVIASFGLLEQHQCLNSRLVFYTDYNDRVPYAGGNENRTAERPSSGIFTFPRGCLEDKIVLRFKGKGRQSKNGNENTPTQKATISSLRKNRVSVFFKWIGLRQGM